MCHRAVPRGVPHARGCCPVRGPEESRRTWVRHLQARKRVLAEGPHAGGFGEPTFPLSQEAVPDKASELAAIPPLLERLGAEEGLKGALVSIDTIATSAAAITGQGADWTPGRFGLRRNGPAVARSARSSGGGCARRGSPVRCASSANGQPAWLVASFYGMRIDKSSITQQTLRSFLGRTSMLRIAVLGCGRIGRMHAANVAAHPRATWRQYSIPTGRLPKK